MLVERDFFLESLLDLRPDGAPPSGRLVFLGGEAGVGKTSLVALLLDRLAALPEPPVVRRGFCDNVATSAPLAPVLDAMPELADALEETTPATRPRLFRDVRALLEQRPTALVIEDVHWADEATLELVRFLGRRLSGLPLLAVATFRDDEVGPHAPLTSLLGDLATVAGVARMHLPSLSLGAVTALVASAGSAMDPETLHERTGGNPFYVTEVLATARDEAPATVRDAVLARTARISSDARDVLAAAAVLGPGASLSLIATVAVTPSTAVDECVQHGLLVEDPVAGGLAFRHEIARETVEASLAPTTRARLHEAAFTTLVDLGSKDHHRLAHHAAGSDRAEEAVQHALIAAKRSARLGGHREAAREYRLALRFADGLDVRQEADLHDRLSYECYLTDQFDDAIEERQRALRLHEQDGDPLRVGAAQRWLSRLSWFLGRREDSERYAERAVTTLEALEPGHELAMALSNMAQLAMLGGVEDEAVRWARRAVDLARALGDREVESHALNNLGTAMSLGSNHTEGMARLHQSLDIALADDLHEHAARAYTNLGTTLVQLHESTEADRALGAGIAYCTERDLDAWRLYMTAWLAQSYLQQGRHAEARRVAERVLTRPGVPVVSRIPSLVVAGRVAVRTGDPAADKILEEAHRLAGQTQEAQRIVPAALARTEAAWAAGDLDRAAHELTVLAEIDPSALTPSERGEAAWWLSRLGGSDRFDVDITEPFRLMIDEHWEEAAARWERLGDPWWRAVCLGLAAPLDLAREGDALLAGLDATGTRQAVQRERHAAGLAVPRGPRERTRSNSAGLTAREVEVLGLLADGLTNAQLADRLFLSAKTVDHHVSAVLRKLGEPNRSAAVAAARRRGLLPNLGLSPDAPSRP